MTRTITAGMVTELEGVGLRPFFLLKVEFDSGDLLLWNGIGQLAWGGDTYEGSGNLLSISAINETEAIIAHDVEFLLEGVDADIISVALAEDYPGRAVTLWLGAFDTSKAIIADPIQIFEGNADVMLIVESATNPTVTLRAENVLRALTRPSPRTWTSEDQKVLYPDDNGFDELPQIQDDPLEWMG